MNDWQCDDERTQASKTGALAGLPALLHESGTLANEIDRLAAKLRIHQTKVTNTMAAISGRPVPTFTRDAEFTVAVTLPNRRLDKMEALIEALQQRYPNATIDDCIADIFEAGMTGIAQQLEAA